MITSDEALSILGAKSLQVGGDHYTMDISPVEYIERNGLGFCEGNVIKYISRHRKKNGKEDIEKAISYCKLILRYQYGYEK